MILVIFSISFHFNFDYSIKAFKKIIYGSLITFLTRFNIINCSQHGIRERGSTQTAAFSLINFVFERLRRTMWLRFFIISFLRTLYGIYFISIGFYLNCLLKFFFKLKLNIECHWLSSIYTLGLLQICRIYLQELFTIDDRKEHFSTPPEFCNYENVTQRSAYLI